MSVAPPSALLSDPSTRHAISACRAVTRARAANFYWGLRLTPEPKRSAMFAVYAWMREVDDLVDERTGGSAGSERARVDAFERTTMEALQGHRCGDAPIWRALAAVAREYPLDASDFRGMIDGQRADLVARPVRSWSELESYCGQVASTVGRVCVRIWGFTDPAAMSLATSRGIAFQLTNILRDVREDAQLGRTYIPSDALEAVGLSLEYLLAWSNPDACHCVLAEVASRARDHYESSAPLEGLIDSDCRATLRALTGIYRALLDRMNDDLSQVVRGRVSIPAHHKLLIALRARWAGHRA